MKSFDPASQKPTGRAFNWSRIHLIYFALAAFDLTAIGAGLALSEWSNAAHSKSVKLVYEINFLRKELQLKEQYLAELSDVSYSMIAKGSSEGVSAQLKALQERQRDIFHVEAFDARVEDAFIAQSGATHEHQSGLDEHQDHGSQDYFGTTGDTHTSHADSMSDHLSEISPELIESFGNYQMLLERVSWHTIEATRGLELAFQNYDEATFKNSVAAALFTARGGFRETAAMSAKLDEAMRESVLKGKEALMRTTFLQYVIGAAILVMVLLACTYAHFTGKLLRRKYNEMQKSHCDLEAAHREKAAQSDELARINGEVTRLNVELSENLKALKSAQDEIIHQDRMLHLGKLTATVAHELRNPLGTVRTSAFLMERKLRGKGTGVEAQIKRITDGVQRCDGIITQLLDFSRSARVKAEPADLDGWLERILTEEAQRLPAEIKVNCSLGLAGLAIPFDPPRLHRAVINLLSNAAEALEGKDGAFKVCHAGAPEITITSNRRSGFAAIEVMDNGPGIAPENLQKIREPLFTTKSFGTGLGIPAIEQIAKQHGGQLIIESDPGKGAKFTLLLPVENEKALAA